MIRPEAVATLYLPLSQIIHLEQAGVVSLNADRVWCSFTLSIFTEYICSRKESKAGIPLEAKDITEALDEIGITLSETTEFTTQPYSLRMPAKLVTKKHELRLKSSTDEPYGNPDEEIVLLSRTETERCHDEFMLVNRFLFRTARG